ncbi:C6 zinc finger domain protein [Paraphaeosphaeria sporulosa]
MVFDYRTASEQDFSRFCSRLNPTRMIISELEGGLSIIKVSNDVVIKCGVGVTQQEADNQKRAFHLIDQKIIRVPRVYRYVAWANIGYLVMEFIDGEPLHVFDDPNICAAVAAALDHFAFIRSDQPGPLGAGPARGILWPPCDSISPSTIVDIEDYYNTRQLQRHRHLSLQSFPLSLCHLDLVPRNVLQLKDGSLCLLDWASAGFYPRFFEICTLRINCPTSKILEACHMDQNETVQADLLEHAYYLGEKYA